MAQIRIIADDKIPFLKGALEAYADIQYLPGKSITADVVKTADAIITRTRTKCNEELLKGSEVKFIASATIGYDHIDTGYCEAAGIEWTNAPGCNASSVQQYILSALLNLGGLKKMDLSKLTLGVIGVGNVGSKVSRAAELLGMRVLKNDPPRARIEGNSGFVDLPVLLRQSDIVTMHVPLNMGGEYLTYHMVNKAFIDQMRDGAILINTSRGQVVEEETMQLAIETKKLSDVILDVFENEPDLNSELLDLLLWATPHIAGYSSDGKANGTMMSVQALSRFFKLGLDDWKPLNVPAPEQQELYLDASGSDIQEMIAGVYLNTYDIKEDDKKLRSNPEKFEALRGDYPLRREAEAYSVRVFNGDKEIFGILEGLGFRVIGDSCY